MKKQLPTETTMVVPVLARLSRSLAVFTLLLLTFPMLRARPALAEHRALYVDAPRPSGAQQYTVTDLGTLPECPLSYAQGINASGQVVGTNCQPYLRRAFLWSDGVMTNLHQYPSGINGSGGFTESWASGINASGQVVGSWTETVCYKLRGCFSVVRAVRWSDGVMSDLGTLPGRTDGWASGINASGQVVGSSSASAYYPRAFLWSDGVMSDLGTLPGDNLSEARGINDSGQVVGFSFYGGPAHAFLWSDGLMSDLGTLPGHNLSEGTGINASGQVVGYSAGPGPAHAFLWSDGLMSDLGTLPGDNETIATGINASGQVVGSSRRSGPARAFVWSDDLMIDLNSLIPPDSGWVLRSAAAINDADQIVGWGLHNGADRGFLLTPTISEVHYEKRPPDGVRSLPLQQLP